VNKIEKKGERSEEKDRAFHQKKNQKRKVRQQRGGLNYKKRKRDLGGSGL